MVKNRSSILVILCLCVATAAWAEMPVLPQQRNNDHINEDTLNVHFYGTVFASPCILSAGSRIQAIDLGDITGRTFHQAGDRSSPIIVKLYLQDCLKGATQGRHSLASIASGDEWRARTTGELAVQLTLIGESDPVNPSLLRTTGTAKGAGIRIMDSAGNLLNLQQTQRPYIVGPGDNIITLLASLGSTERDVVAGSFSGLLRIRMEYL